MTNDWDCDPFGKAPEEEITCRKCENTDVQEKYDYYGISTGYWCDNCYENNYPYRKDAYYDYLNAGEHLDEDY